MLVMFVTGYKCVFLCPGGGGTGRRSGPGGEKVEQKNPADAPWPSGLHMSSQLNLKLQTNPKPLVCST